MTAILGPFGTYEEYTFGGRLLYWGSLVFVALVPAFVIQSLTFRFVKGPVVLVDAISAMVMAWVIGTCIWAFNVSYMGFPLDDIEGYGLHLVMSLMICCVPVAVRASLRITPDAAVRNAVPEVAPVITAPPPAFMRRLEPADRGTLLSVSADNHQLEVWTDRGQTRLWLRFRDALHELGDLPGARIHRSHWVAYEAIKSVETKGRRIEVELQCGRVLPVSAMGVEPLREAGLLTP